MPDGSGVNPGPQAVSEPWGPVPAMPALRPSPPAEILELAPPPGTDGPRPAGRRPVEADGRRRVEADGRRRAVPAERAGLAPADALRRATRLALGVAGLAAEAAEAALERLVPADTRDGGSGPVRRPPGLLRLLPGAAIGLGLEAQRRSFDAVSAVVGRFAPVVSVATRPPIVRRPLDAARRRLDGWNELGRVEQRRNQDIAAAFAHAVVTELIAAVLDEVDVDEIVARVDIGAIVDRLDLDAIVDRIDLDTIVDRIDLDTIVSRIDIGAIIDRLDLDAIVDRIDLDAIVGRVDVGAVVERVDVPVVIEQVMDEVDVGGIIRESTSTVTAEAVDAFRVQGMNADRLLNRLVDRLLLRKGERRTGLPGLAPPPGRRPPSEDAR